jgi:hypothetical protein
MMLLIDVQQQLSCRTHHFDNSYIFMDIKTKTKNVMKTKLQKGEEVGN